LVKFPLHSIPSHSIPFHSIQIHQLLPAKAIASPDRTPGETVALLGGLDNLIINPLAITSTHWPSHINPLAIINNPLAITHQPLAIIINPLAIINNISNLDGAPTYSSQFQQQVTSTVCKVESHLKLLGKNSA
jgi:hypothetical protein